MTQASGRLLSLLSLLQARRDWPGQLLAERLNVTPRTVRRDIDRLRELGYPVVAVKGPDGGYRLEAGTDVPPLLFDDDQAVAVTVALQLAAGSGADIADAATRALATMRQVMPNRLRHRIDAVQVTVVDRSPQKIDSAVLLALSAAVRAREVLRFDYEHESPRRIEPHHLINRAGRWYLVGWDLGRDDWRVYRADRMTPKTPTGPRFSPREVPGGDVVAFVNARFKGAAGGRDAWPCQGEAVIDLPAAEVAPFAGDGIVEPIDDDRCRLVAGSWSWVGLAASLGRFDAAVHIVGPAELRDAALVLARRYRDSAG
ncbi:helix-turn-helix transcriptional regulator [Lentzea aerocolonigenes]|uniref:helix-turn-helix transcriptional regulator n=1 Tax=Lentzea aerocolonigenes TaxID=68170 RepID=UPI0004C319D3|nr:WYL domain-containing protein [Lentzea aerocolonigenes]MCP2241808.1 HTH domain-containing protein [Lentzea aerocolonigenes]